MLKIVCLALRHRVRVVQEFSPSQRRLKCERCGGDWGMHDGVRAIVDWSPELQQMYRDFGYEILEPIEEIPLTRLELLRALTWPEVLRACRWPGAFAVLVGTAGDWILGAAGVQQPARSITVFAITFAVMNLLMRRAYRREHRRRRNSLQA
jgi:hypothetical protein